MRNKLAIYLAEADAGLPTSDAAPTIYASAVSTFTAQVSAAISQSSRWQHCCNPDEADVVLVREPWGFKNWHYIPLLQQNKFLRRFAKKIIVYNSDDRTVPFFPGFYTSIPRTKSWAIEAEPFPYWSTFLDSNANDGQRSPKLLWYFRGLLDTHSIRRKLYKALAGRQEGVVESSQSPAWGQNTEEDRQRFIEGLLSTHFALCPRGASPSSFRLYEAMQLGVAPVVISDDWRPPNEIAWEDFAVFVRERDVRHIPRILASAAHESQRMGRLARGEWERTLSSAQIPHYFLRQLELFVETRWLPRSFDELWAIWHSKEFARSNGWHVAGRARSRLGRHLNAVDLFFFRLQTAAPKVSSADVPA